MTETAITIEADDDTEIVTADEIFDPAPWVKLIVFTRSMSLAEGTQAVTGVGFSPRLVLFQNGPATGTNSNYCSIGLSDGTTDCCLSFVLGTPTVYYRPAAGVSASGDSAYLDMTVDSFDADGFTVNWEKTGSPTGTATINALCFR